MGIAEVVYLLCALTSVLCAALLVRGWRQSRTRLLLWSSLCFVTLAVNNALLFVDLVLVQNADLAIPRTMLALAGIGVLIYGLVWDTR